MTLKAVTCYCG